MRPFKEVILFDNIQGNTGRLVVTPTTNYQIKTNAVHILWRGSIEKFKKDFEIPKDAPLDTKATNPGPHYGSSGRFVTEWDATTLNFKFNYQLWYRDKATTNTDNYFVNGSNGSVNLTIPNVLVFDGDSQTDSAIFYANTSGAPTRFYNPNLFPLDISVNDFIISNKVSDFSYIRGNGTNSGIYLMFRYGVGGDDIQICLLTRDSGNFQVNSSTLVMPYASLTFTGFNKIKRLVER